jgi:WXG100 family type VII secretion target
MMTQIRIDTQHAREVGRQFTAEGNRLAEIGQELQGAIGSLDTWAWDGHSRRQAESMLGRVRPEGAQLSQQLADLGHQLVRVADAFEQADGQSASAVDAIPRFMLEPSLGWRTNPALRLGSLLAGGGGAAIALITLRVTGTHGQVSFVDRLKGIPSAVARWLSPAVAAVAGWFGWQGSISKEPAESVAWEELHETKVEPERAPEEKPVTPSQPRARESTEATAATLPPQSLTPVLRQTAGSYECAPTAASMVLSYWHRLDSDNQVRTPNELIQGLDGRFSPKSGINADELVAGLKEMNLGYETIERRALLDQQGLQAELKDGPVIAQVRLNLGASGYPHMVTVTGMSENGQTVYLNDPWTGKSSEVAWSAFEKSWAFTGQYSQASHLIVKIRP